MEQCSSGLFLSSAIQQNLYSFITLLKHGTQKAVPREKPQPERFPHRAADRAGEEREDSEIRRRADGRCGHAAHPGDDRA